MGCNGTDRNRQVLHSNITIKENNMNNDTWETARSVMNGGTLTFLEVAALWKQRSVDHFYPLSTEPSNKWIDIEFMKKMRSRPK